MTLDLSEVQKITKKGKESAAKREYERQEAQRKKEDAKNKAYFKKYGETVKKKIEKGIKAEAKKGANSSYHSFGQEEHFKEYQALLWRISEEMPGFWFNISKQDGEGFAPSFISCTVSWKV